jgi:hypothetical protein
MDPALGNQSDPADQDSRTSFPDKDDFGAFAPVTTVPPLLRRYKSGRSRSRKLPSHAISAKQVSAVREVGEGVFGRTVDRRYASDPPGTG